MIDPDRQLNVLTTSFPKKTTAPDSCSTQRGKVPGAERFFDELFEEIEPDQGTVDFSQMEYGTVSVDFGDTVEIVDAYLMENEITPLETAISEVTADQQKEQIYEVKAGDTLSQIAEDNGLAIANLVAINPTLDNENSVIRTGDELIITVPGAGAFCCAYGTDLYGRYLRSRCGIYRQ